MSYFSDNVCRAIDHDMYTITGHSYKTIITLPVKPKFLTSSDISKAIIINCALQTISSPEQKNENVNQIASLLSDMVQNSPEFVTNYDQFHR